MIFRYTSNSITPFALLSVAFVLGMTDRVNHFADDVDGKDPRGNKKTEAQNFTGAINIAGYLALAFPKIVDWLKNIH